MNGSQDDPTPDDGQHGSWRYSTTDQPSQMSPDQSANPAIAQRPEPDEVSWSASEFIAHQKGAGWYGLLLLAALAASAIVYLITHDIVTCTVIVIVAVLFGISASHKPRVLDYRLDRSGLSIGRKFYSYASFKAFSVIDEGSFSNITFVPFKRFMPGLTIYYDPKDEEKIVNALAAHLPMEQVKHDTFDRLMRRVRF
ncbi:MAG TPA: hypothetical protein VJP80_07700 [Candidatus Saccharimonadales bacterium]|nr:hypothetical protein [Candidatus Saccharimonadales bacterium]